MNQKTLDKIKNQLLADKKQLEESLSEFAEKGENERGGYRSKFPKLGSSPEENAAEVTMFSDNLSLEENLEKSLKDVNQALERIKSGDYGVCKYCRQPIDEKRLLARPASSACVACKIKLKSKPGKSWLRLFRRR